MLATENIRFLCARRKACGCVTSGNRHARGHLAFGLKTVIGIEAVTAASIMTTCRCSSLTLILFYLFPFVSLYCVCVTAGEAPNENHNHFSLNLVLVNRGFLCYFSDASW